MTKTSTDPIADMLTRIRNAVAVRKTVVTLPHSNIKESVAKLLVANGFVENVATEKDTVGKLLKVTINSDDKNASITEIERLSRPGRRQYAGAGDIPKVKQGRGIIIISTPQGVMTGDEAISKKVGGELICKVY